MLCKMTARCDLVAPTDRREPLKLVAMLCKMTNRPARAAEPANIKPLPIGGHVGKNDGMARAGDTERPARAHQIESLDAVAAGHALQNDRPAQVAELANIKPLPIGSHVGKNDRPAQAVELANIKPLPIGGHALQNDGTV